MSPLARSPRIARGSTVGGARRVDPRSGITVAVAHAVARAVARAVAFVVAAVVVLVVALAGALAGASCAAPMGTAPSPSVSQAPSPTTLRAAAVPEPTTLHAAAAPEPTTLHAAASPEPARTAVAHAGDCATTTSCAWWVGRVFYEIYPRSFADSDGDGVGDLRGVTAHLDDLRALGIDALWLTPIHPTQSKHGYDVMDYEGVAHDLGSLADVDALTAAAHARGMHVILDFVLNHTSSQHPWFRAHPERYVWRDKPDDRWRRPWDNADPWHEDPLTHRFYLGLFSDRMPDLNLENDDVVEAMLHAMRFWLAHGVDGFRIDAARYLVEEDDGAAVHMADTAKTHTLVRRIHAALGDRVLLVAEAWTDSATIGTYTAPGEFQLAFSFGVSSGLVDALREEQRSPLVEALAGAEAAFPVRAAEAPFLTNHDEVRVMRQLDGDVDRARLGAAALLALPGTPFLYYGEEIGMQGLPGRDDANKRTALSWPDVAAERADPASLWHTYASLIALRRAHPALSAGDSSRPHVDGGGRGAFALLRTDSNDNDAVLFVANFAHDAAAAFEVDTSARKPKVIATSAPGVDVSMTGDGRVHIAGLPPHGFVFIELD